MAAFVDEYGFTICFLGLVFGPMLWLMIANDVDRARERRVLGRQRTEPEATVSQRVGTCSVCGIALQGNEGEAVPRSKTARKQGHHHKREWHVVPDEVEPDHGFRGWMEDAP